MPFGVGLILKLLQYNSPRDGRPKLLCYFYGSLHAVFSRRKFHLRAVCLHQVSSLNAHCFGHGKYELIALNGSHKCQTHTRIAASRFDNGCSGFQQAAAFSILNHSQRNAIFHTSARVKTLYLCHDGRFKVVGSRKLTKFQQRGASD